MTMADTLARRPPLARCLDGGGPGAGRRRRLLGRRAERGARRRRNVLAGLPAAPAPGRGEGLRQCGGPLRTTAWNSRRSRCWTASEFGSDSLERPALVPLDDGTWRLYVSCATPGTKHWRVDALDADHPSGFGPARPRTVLPGDEGVGVKDPVVKVEGRPVAHVALLPPAGPPRRHRPHVDQLLHQPRRASPGRRSASPWPARRVAGTNGAPGWPTWSAGTAAGWPTTTGGPARRRTPRSGPASPSATTPGALVADGRGASAHGPTAGGRSGTSPWCRYPTAAPGSTTRPAASTGAHDLRTEYVPPAR